MGFKKYISTPWANGGLKREIPDQASGVVGAASFELGFPSITMIPIPAGGKAPNGLDFNGILNSITSTLQEVQAGTVASFDESFADAIGGYPKGAILLGADDITLWQSTVDTNTTDPDSVGAAGWQKVVTEKTLTDRFTIIYPNGGSPASPANITNNSRYVLSNPFPGHPVECKAEILSNGRWGEGGQSYMIRDGQGLHAGWFCGMWGDDIVLQTAINMLLGPASSQLHVFGSLGYAISAPCRIKVWRID